MKVLIVEDEVGLAKALAEIMTDQKYMADVVHDGEEGLAYGRSGQYDIILLDVMLPKRSGFEVARRLREEKVATPIIMLTAKGEIPDKVQGLDSGADDYMTKPFSPEELLARIRAMCRRPGEVIYEELTYADLTLNLSTGMLHCGAKSVHLGHKEIEVLRLLILARQAITSKDTLLDKVWGVESGAEDNNVEAYISFLRKKFFFLGSRVGITSIRRAGYRLEEQAS